MDCGDELKRGGAACVCSGRTVFEGAVIGQVFTGDVQMRCVERAHCTTRDRSLIRTLLGTVAAVVALASACSGLDLPKVHDFAAAYIAVRAVEWVDSMFKK